MTSGGWTQQSDGSWALPVDGGTLTVPAHFTPLDPARADTGWKQNSQPTETCGATTVGMFGRLVGPCLNAPGHPKGSWHRDDRGTEWREYEPAEATRHPAHVDGPANYWDCPGCVASLKERAEEAERLADSAEQQRDQLRATLDEVLRHFVHKGHPGEPCLQTGWISEKTVARWRAIAYPTKDGSK